VGLTGSLLRDLGLPELFFARSKVKARVVFHLALPAWQKKKVLVFGRLFVTVGLMGLLSLQGLVDTLLAVCHEKRKKILESENACWAGLLFVAVQQGKAAAVEGQILAVQKADELVIDWLVVLPEEGGWSLAVFGLHLTNDIRV
jgi:hypothetical protein